MKFKKFSALALAAVTALSCASALSACGGHNKLSYLKTEGELVKNEEGETVTLRGINAGGLFVTEHWMCGFLYGKTPSNDYRSLTRTFIERFGEQKTKELWAEYRKNFWTDDDFANCADMGFNTIRLPFTYMNVDFDAIGDYEKAGKNYDFSALDAFVEKAADYGMYTILDLHGAYGSQNGQDHSGQIFGTASEVDFYTNEKMMSLTADLWSALSKHYKDNPNVAGYDILNEPGEKAGTTSGLHWQFYDRVYDAIRANGDEHIVIFESCWDAENLPHPSLYGWENCIYSFHHYPTGAEKLTFDENLASWNTKMDAVEKANFGVPLQMGEFTNYTSADKWDCILDLLNRSGWHWASWTYKVWGNMPWGVINVRGDNSQKVDPAADDYETILAKFATLRTDGEKSKKYEFTVVRDDQSYVRSLFEIFAEYSQAPVAARPDAATYTLAVDEGWWGPIDNGRIGIVEIASYAQSVTINYDTAQKKLAQLSVGSLRYYIDKSDGNALKCGSNWTEATAAFSPVEVDGGIAFVSHSLGRYLCVDDGVIRASAVALKDATVFSIV